MSFKANIYLFYVIKIVPTDLFSQNKSRYLHKTITGHCMLFNPTKNY